MHIILIGEQMKTLTKILRSITTSLLLFAMIIAIFIQFAFTSLHLSSKNLRELIDNQTLLDIILEDKIADDRINSLACEYVDDYLDYVFYKRSFPSLQNVNYDSVKTENIDYAKKTINELKEKLDLDYETVLTLRSINNVLSNGSIFLLINIGVFLLFVIVSIIKKSFKEGLKLFSLALVITALAILLIGAIIYANLANILPLNIYNLVVGIIDGGFMTSLFNQAIVYMIIGFVAFMVLFTVDHLPHKKISNRN